VSLAAVAGIGRHHDLAGVLLVMQGVEQPRHHPRRVAESRVDGHVLHPLAVDVDSAIVAQRIEIFGAGLRGRLASRRTCLRRGLLDRCLRVALIACSHGSHPPCRSFLTFTFRLVCSDIELSCGIRSNGDHTRRSRVKQG
jgi:hypothetical protein